MKTIRALLAVFIFLGGAYVVYRVMPVYMNNYQFQDAIAEEARMNTYNRQKSEEDIRQEVLERAKALDIPVTGDEIQVQRNSVAVTISAAYTVHVDLPVHPLDLKFTPNSQSSRLY